MGTMKIGLIGGIGSGKSRVAEALAQRGAVVITADTLGHEALRQPAIRQALVSRWGNAILTDGEIDRKKLAAIVFANEEDRRFLESCSFPWIEQQIRERIQAAQADPKVPMVVLDAAIMLETGWGKECDRILFVDAPRELRLARLKEQRGWTEADLAAREQAQMPLDQKRKFAHAIIENRGSLEALHQRLDEILAEWGIGTCPPSGSSKQEQQRSHPPLGEK